MMSLGERAVEQGAVQKWTELDGLLSVLLDQKIERVLEVGSKDGGTLWLWRQFAPEVVSIDVNPVPLQMDGVTLITDNSRNVQLRGTFDFVFIDGDHTYEGVLADWQGFSLHSTGLVAFHDIVPYDGPEHRGVDRLWDEIKADYPGRTMEWIDPGDFPVRGEVLTARDGGIGLVNIGPEQVW